MAVFSDGISEKLQDGQSLLTHLEGSGKLSEDNFSDLKNLLGDVYRMDLIKKIDDFSISEGTKKSGALLSPNNLRTQSIDCSNTPAISCM